MATAFSQALKAITKASASAFESVRERILPSPAKRKREHGEDKTLEHDRRKRRMQNKDDGEDKEEGSLHPESQFAHAAQPPADLSEVTKGVEIQPQSDANPHMSPGQQEDPSASGISVHNTAGKPVAESKGVAGQGAWGMKAAPKEAQFRQELGAAAELTPQNSSRLPDSVRPDSLAPWQRRYPTYTQAKLSIKDAMTIPHELQFSPARRTDRSGFRRGVPSLLRQSYKHTRQKHPTNRLQAVRKDLKERDVLRIMTSNWEAMRPKVQSTAAQRIKPDIVDLEPSQDLGERPDLQEGQDRQSEQGERPARFALQAQQPGTLQNQATSLQLWQGVARPDVTPSLAAAEFQLEKAKAEQRADEMREQRKKALARCAELMGTKQSDLFARVNAALGERPYKAASKASQSVAAEISKASMDLAISKARELEGSEVSILEAQQDRLRQLRQAQQAAQRPAQSSKKPEAASPNGIAPARGRALPSIMTRSKAKPQTEEVVDLLSSDDEGEAQDEEDEAATLHGEISPRDASQAEEVSYSDEAEDDEEGEEADEDDLQAKLRDISVSEELPPGFQPLTKQQVSQYRDALNNRADPSTELKVHKSTYIGVTRGLMACLKDRVWLNDEVMNLFMGLLQDRDKAWRPGGEHPKCHLFSTFFFNKLYIDKGYDYSSVSRWTRSKKLKNCGQESSSVLDCDRIIAPVHLGVHWTCAMVDLKKRELAYFDSMGGRNKEIMNSLRQYVADEYRDKKQQEVDTSSWKIRYNPGRVPVQMNGCDCGVFTLMFAEHLARGADLTFDQAHMPYFRKMVAAAIMNLALPT